MRLFIEQGKLVLQLSLLEKILSVSGGIRVPLSQVKDIHYNSPKPTWKQIRIPGTHFPGSIKAGTYRTKRDKKRWDREFWYVTRSFTGDPAIMVIELRNHIYDRIVINNINPDIVSEMNTDIRTTQE